MSTLDRIQKAGNVNNRKTVASFLKLRKMKRQLAAKVNKSVECERKTVEAAKRYIKSNGSAEQVELVEQLITEWSNNSDAALEQIKDIRSAVRGAVVASSADKLPEVRAKAVSSIDACYNKYVSGLDGRPVISNLDSNLGRVKSSIAEASTMTAIGKLTREGRLLVAKASALSRATNVDDMLDIKRATSMGDLRAVLKTVDIQ